MPRFRQDCCPLHLRGSFPPELWGRCPHPSVPEARAVLGSHRVTQILEHLSEAVEQSSLFDPQHPGLEEELESLRQHLEALSSPEPSSMETHLSSRAGALCSACSCFLCGQRQIVPACTAPSKVMVCGNALPLSCIAALGRASSGVMPSP